MTSVWLLPVRATDVEVEARFTLYPLEDDKSVVRSGGSSQCTLSAEAYGATEAAVNTTASLW